MKNKTKKMLKTIGLVLVGVLACGLLLHVTGTDIENPFDKTADVNNLIDFKAEETNYIIGQKTGYGVDVEVDEDDGEITLKGKSTSALDLKVAEVTLKAGTYRISGLTEYTKNGFNMSVKQGSTILAYSGVEHNDRVEISDTFTLEDDTTIVVWLSWENEHEFTSIRAPFGTKVNPVISEVKVVTTETEAAE